ncbi:DUF2827 family protein [Burkholderia sp. Bp8986]|uniref:DUF2827 family protein n=1 Tax=Burkholderia sp. Bp8986 TaxID=2184550 RepID=UPI000F5A772B|nr:DUF2827 family protein [Burkholderia sp. Bp8986]RQS52772.1 DUF2827 domain-containing protein [Burkholderia sp. Bp8986]
MRIGISLATRPGHTIWDNGLGQNVFFLAKLLRALPAVRDVILLNCGFEMRMPADAEALMPDLKMLRPDEATELVDVVIEMSVGLDVAWLDHLRARGKKVVYLCCGQPYVGLIEPSIFQRGGYVARADRCDEIWILPKDRVFGPMLETLHRCPVHEVPFLWDPMFVDHRANALNAEGQHFGYVPATAPHAAPRALRVAIFEPNISVVKCCMVPMLICDAAFRAAPDTIAEMRVLNGAHLEQHPTFSFMRNGLDLHREGRVYVDHRHDFVDYMSRSSDTVVAHQWQNDQNILYLDALYGGYPLIHNSAWLRGFGYYYPEFEVSAGARALVRAARQHDANHADYVRDARTFLAGLHPHSPENGARYFQQLLSVTARGRGREA